VCYPRFKAVESVFHELKINFSFLYVDLSEVFLVGIGVSTPSLILGGQKLYH
jgi:hypothetical protein